MTERIPYQAARLDALATAAVAVTAPGAIFEVTGPGAVTCLQGLLTADVEAGGPGRLGYGALLTPKGMIVADYWLGRAADRTLLIGDPVARAPTADAFRRLLPPRLAKAADRSDEWTVLWVVGAAVPGIAEGLGAALPAAGRIGIVESAEGPHWIARGDARAWFQALLAGPSMAIEAARARLEAAGIAAGVAADLRAARVLHGAPTLGAEIDDRTLPQEAGFDGLGGVSYSKGCYVGQETVARLHFRGHANWLLRRISAPAVPIEGELEFDGKPVAKLGTLLVLEDERIVGLARVRREIEPGATIGRCLVEEIPPKH